MNRKTLLLLIWNIWKTYCFWALFTAMLGIGLNSLGKILFGWDGSFMTFIISGIIVGIAMWEGVNDAE